MSIMDFFASQGTASPSPDSERGDWIDWYLNREGPAGRFRGSRRPRYGIDYLFNGGGSVRSRPSNLGHDRAGPTQLERVFQDNTIRSGPEVDLNFLRNLQQGPGVIDRTIRDRTPPGGGVIEPKNPGLPPWYKDNIGEGSFWNVNNQQSGQDSGIMAAVANNPGLVQQAKGFYDLFDPWMPNVDVGENSFGYEFEKPILGGTLGYGFDYDWDDEDVGAFFNWKKELGA